MRKIIGTAIVSLALLVGIAPAANAYQSPNVRRLCGVTRIVHQSSYEIPQPDGSVWVMTQYVAKRTKCRTGVVVTHVGSYTTFIPAPAPATTS
jgi:hypothetical protein